MRPSVTPSPVAMATAGFLCGRTIFVLTILCSLTRASEATGQYVYLSRYEESGSVSDASISANSSSSSSSSSNQDAPIDFCVTGVQSFQVNITSSSSLNADAKYRVVRFRSSDDLLASRPLERKSYSRVFVTRDPRFGCVKADSPNYEDGFSSSELWSHERDNIRWRTIVQVLKVSVACMQLDGGCL